MGSNLGSSDLNSDALTTVLRPPERNVDFHCLLELWTVSLSGADWVHGWGVRGMQPGVCAVPSVVSKRLRRGPRSVRQAGHPSLSHLHDKNPSQGLPRLWGLIRLRHSVCRDLRTYPLSPKQEDHKGVTEGAPVFRSSIKNP